MYRDSVRFITKITLDNMPPHLRERWSKLGELEKLMLIKGANRMALQDALDTLNENNSWAVVEMVDDIHSNS